MLNIVYNPLTINNLLKSKKIFDIYNLNMIFGEDSDPLAYYDFYGIKINPEISYILEDIEKKFRLPLKSNIKNSLSDIIHLIENQFPRQGIYFEIYDVGEKITGIFGTESNTNLDALLNNSEFQRILKSCSRIGKVEKKNRVMISLPNFEFIYYSPHGIFFEYELGNKEEQIKQTFNLSDDLIKKPRINFEDIEIKINNKYVKLPPHFNEVKDFIETTYPDRKENLKILEIGAVPMPFNPSSKRGILENLVYYSLGGEESLQYPLSAHLSLIENTRVCATDIYSREDINWLNADFVEGNFLMPDTKEKIVNLLGGLPDIILGFLVFTNDVSDEAWYLHTASIKPIFYGRLRCLFSRGLRA
jgi:hypothetical protein